MSKVFEGYERQYCKIFFPQVRRRLRPRRREEEAEASEIQADVQESESLTRRMDLKERSLQPSVKAGLLAKLREYKSDLSNDMYKENRFSCECMDIGERESGEYGSSPKRKKLPVNNPKKQLNVGSSD